MTSKKSNLPPALFSAVVAMGIAVLAPGLAAAQGVGPSNGIGFRTPSDNIHCMLESNVPEANLPPAVRCDIAEIDNRAPPRPRSCEQDWGKSFRISAADTSGQLICAGDTARLPEHPVLAYGAVWQRDGFTCLSERTGLSCFNATRHGFTLSRSGQKMF